MEKPINLYEDFEEALEAYDKFDSIERRFYTNAPLTESTERNVPLSECDVELLKKIRRHSPVHSVEKKVEEKVEVCSENPNGNDERYTEDGERYTEDDLGNNENNNQDYRLSYSIPTRDLTEEVGLDEVTEVVGKFLESSENPSEEDERYTEDDEDDLGNNENNNQDYRLSYSIPTHHSPVDLVDSVDSVDDDEDDLGNNENNNQDYRLSYSIPVRDFVNQVAKLLTVKNSCGKNISKSRMQLEYTADKVKFNNVKYVETFEDIPKVYGRKWKQRLEIFSKLTEHIRDYTMSFAQKSVALPSTSDKLQKLLGVTTQHAVTKVIKKAVDSGLIKVVDKDYVPGRMSKYYTYNMKKVNEVIFLHNKYNLENVLGNNENNNQDYRLSYSIPVRDTEPIDAKTLKKVKIKERTLLPGKYSDEQYIEAVKQNYKYFKAIEKVNEENNEMLKHMFADKGAWKYLSRFTPSVRRSKNGRVTKIGIRATNAVCNIPKAGSVYTRKDLLQDTFDSDKVYEFDVKSSIYRVTYYLNTGKWLENDNDFYQMMAPYKFESNEDREAFKSLCMRLYFSASSKSSAAKLLGKLKNTVNDDDVIDNIEKSIDSNIGKLFDNMRNVIGKTYGSEVFLHESSLYIILMNRLLKAGYKVVQIYDGFYCDKPIKDFCLDNLKEIAEEYRKITA